VAPFEEFSDPRLVALYDTLCPLGQDTKFFLELAAELSASVIVDVGCGTGSLTCELAQRGHQMTGVEPSPAMLEVARHRPGGDRVRWIDGDAGCLHGAPADLALMTSHVAQIIGDDADWHATLGAIHRALRPGGRVAFESRNPGARAWVEWTPHRSRRRVEDAAPGPIDTWIQSVEVLGEHVRYELHYRFVSTDEELVSTTELRFRTQGDLTESLADAGFSVEHVFGDWDRQPVEVGSPELIFVAVRQ
jgi:SAM-dependent methyltransferase